MGPQHPWSGSSARDKHPSVELTSYAPIQLDEQSDGATRDQAARPNVRKSQGIFGRIFVNWWAELLAGIILTLSFGGLIAVLRSYQDHPIPHWPLGFSLNTALAVFGVIFRAPILFIAVEGIGQLKWQWYSRTRPLSQFSDYDNATRGPWGATKLIWIARWKNLPASLAALIIVVSFGIEPFTQAVVRYYSCDIKVQGPASISHVNSYFAQKPGYNVPTWARLALDTRFSDPTAIMPNFSCRTRCDFPDVYHTVGLCSKCVDVTDELQQTCNSDQNYPACNYTLTRYAGMDTTAGYETAATVARRQIVSNGTIPTWSVFAAHKFSTRSWQNNITSPLTTNGSAPDFQSSTIDFVSASPVLASRCFLYYCTRTYTGFIESQRLNETLNSTNSNWSVYSEETPVLGTVRVSCLKPNVQAHLKDKGFVSQGAEWMAWNGTYLNGTEAQDGISQSTNLTLPANCVYQTQVLDDTLDWLPDEFFTDHLTGTLTGDGPKGNVTLDTKSSSLLAGLYNNGQVTAKSLDKAFESFTTAISNYMRIESSPIPRNITSLLPDYISKPNITLNPVQGNASEQNQLVLGENLLSTTCIHVRWPWLALPAAIFVATLVFLVLLIAKTAMNGEQEIWKSSQNALIWHGLSGSAEHESVVLATKKDMDDRARQIAVQLRQTKRGWKLVQEE